MLETGDRQHEAMAPDERAGFARTACFGECGHSGASGCTEKPPDRR